MLTIHLEKLGVICEFACNSEARYRRTHCSDDGETTLYMLPGRDMEEPGNQSQNLKTSFAPLQHVHLVNPFSRVLLVPSWSPFYLSVLVHTLD